MTRKDSGRTDSSRKDGSTKASAAMWRNVLAFAVGLLTMLAMSGGLVYWVPWLQVGVVLGVGVGLVASAVLPAALVAAAAGVVGSVIGPANAWGAVPDPVTRLWQAIALALIAAGCAALTAAIRGRNRQVPRILLWVAVALVVANLWVTTLTVSSFAVIDSGTGQRIPSLNEQLKGSLPAAIARSDNAFYFEVDRAMRGGEGYYAAFDRLYRAAVGKPAGSMLNVRLPLLYEVWRALPSPRWVLYLFLALASGAALCTVPFVSGGVKTPLAIPAAAALSAYFLAFSTQLAVFSQEPWAGALSVLGVTAIAVSFRRESRVAVWAACGVAALALGTLVRETLAVFMLSGTASAVWPRTSRQTRRLIIWGSGLAVTVALYAVHWSRAAGVVDTSSPAGRFGAGGIAFMLGALSFATNYLGGEGWLPWALAVIGIAGAAMHQRVAMRVLLLGGIASSLVAFLFVSNGAVASTNGLALNYWGASLLPLVYLCLPFALLVVPGASASVAVGSAKR